MTIALCALISVLLSSATGAGVAFWLRARTSPTLSGHRVTVHTAKPDDQTITGVLVGDYRDRLTLADSSYVTKDGTVPMPDSTQHIYVRQVAWIDDHGDAGR